MVNVCVASLREASSTLGRRDGRMIFRHRLCAVPRRAVNYARARGKPTSSRRWNGWPRNSAIASSPSRLGAVRLAPKRFRSANSRARSDMLSQALAMHFI